MKNIRFFFLIFLAFLSACEATQKPAPVTLYNLGQGAGSTGIHTVSKGETLDVLSKRYNIAARDIAVVNRLAAPFYLSPGQRLKLPPPQVYKVKAGDSLRTVSRLFGVSSSEIAKMNRLRAPYTLARGQVLRLPSVTQKREPQAFMAQAPAQVVLGRAENLAPVPLGEVTAEPLAPPPLQMHKPPPSSYSADALASQGFIEKDPGRDAVPDKTAFKPVNAAAAEVPKRASSKFLSPVKGSIISGYGPKSDGLFNDGVNIKAPKGSPVAAAENGIVVFAGNELKGFGNLVLIRHADRWMTAYGHMDQVTVGRGDVVRRGQAIGTVGNSGAVESSQLHFEVRRGTEAINPVPHLEGGKV